MLIYATDLKLKQFIYYCFRDGQRETHKENENSVLKSLK